MLRAYDAWDTRPLVLPRPTRLYSLAPIGVGTPMVESLTGYVVRLAEAHCVAAGLLYWQEIRTLAGKGNIFTFRVTRLSRYLCNFFYIGTRSPNRITNWLSAAFHSGIGWVHFFATG